MICNECGSKMKVKDTYTIDNIVYRRYACPKCKSLFYTTECEDSRDMVIEALNKKQRKESHL